MAATAATETLAERNARLWREDRDAMMERVRRGGYVRQQRRRAREELVPELAPRNRLAEPQRGIGGAERLMIALVRLGIERDRLPIAAALVVALDHDARLRREREGRAAAA